VSDGAPSAAEGLAELTQRRQAAEERVLDVEREARSAGEARETARRELVAFERNGSGSAAERTKLERALNEAESRVSERWAERIAGARAAVADAQGAIRDYSAANLDELVAGLTREGEAAAERVNSAAEALVEACRRHGAIGSQISATIHGAGIHVTPDDVSRPRAGEVARAAATLLQRGGEEAPRVGGAVRERMRAKAASVA
jgi:chromosome segregation ATPase